MVDIVEVLRADPGSRTFGQLAQERQSALLEILRLRRELDHLERGTGTKPVSDNGARVAASVSVQAGNAPEVIRPGSLLRL